MPNNEPTANDKKGIVLISSLILIAILALMGTIAVITTTTEVLICGNYKTGIQALYAAEAGGEEARARLRWPTNSLAYAGDPSLEYNQNWCAYILANDFNPVNIDPNYDDGYSNFIPTTTGDHTNTNIEVNSIQASQIISYWVKIRHKTEYDAEQDGHTPDSPHYIDNDGDTSTHTSASPGNIIYYGYGNSSDKENIVQFTLTQATMAIHEPVEIITAWGYSGTAVKTIRTEAVHHPGPPIIAAVYAKGNVTVNGINATIDGNDAHNIIPNTTLHSLKYLNTATLAETEVAHTYKGSTGSAQSTSINIDIPAFINTLKDYATVRITSDQSRINCGSSSNFVTCYSDTANPFNSSGLQLDHVRGYGMLLVKGDLTLTGGVAWNGLILATGSITIDGTVSGNISILGAVLGNYTLDIDSSSETISIQYHSGNINNAVNTLPLKVTKWDDDSF